VITKLNFKFIINDKIYDEFELINKQKIFKIEGKEYTQKKLSSFFDTKVICDKCGCESPIKSLQPLTFKNKPFLCRKCRSIGELNSMFGKKHSEKTLSEMSKNRSGEKNSFYGKKHTKETKEKQSIIKKCKNTGEENPMYGKTIFDFWYNKYPPEIVEKMIDDYKKLQSEKKSGDKNSMYGKTIFQLWVDKCGEECAKIKFNEWRSKITKTVNFLYQNTNIKEKISKSLKGREFTDEHIKNLRLSSIKNVERRLSSGDGKLVPSFNVRACELFDIISNNTGVNIQHALNGGELHIKDLGFWVDGYDKKNNVVYEYYEKHHNRQIEKDEKRINQIRDFLGCEIIIIKEGEENKYLNNEI